MEHEINFLETQNRQEEEEVQELEEIISPNLYEVSGREEQWTTTNVKVLARHISSNGLQKMQEEDDNDDS